MDHLTPSNVPVYGTREEGRAVWNRCADRGTPLVAVRNGERGWIVRYDLAYLDAALTDDAVAALRDRVRRWRSYPTGTDPISQSEGVGGEAGSVSGALHAPTEREARRLAAELSAFVFDRSNWTDLH